MRCVPQVHGAIRDALALCPRACSRSRSTAPPTTRSSSPTAPTSTPTPRHGRRPRRLGRQLPRPAGGPGHGLRQARHRRAGLDQRAADRAAHRRPRSSGLPPFLVEDAGLNSGMMLHQYAAAALVSENKVLVHPASADSIPTSANQEDHVSMGSDRGAPGARRSCATSSRCWRWSCCVPAQGLDFRLADRRAARGAGVAEAHRRCASGSTISRATGTRVRTSRRARRWCAAERWPTSPTAPRRERTFQPPCNGGVDCARIRRVRRSRLPASIRGAQGVREGT